MPPVMASAAFVMAEWLGISYWAVCLAAFIPACLYYLALFWQVDIEAAKNGLKGVPRSQCPSFWKALREGWVALVPLVALIVFLGVMRFSPGISGLYAILSLIIVSQFRKKTRLGLTQFRTALRGSGANMPPAGIACASAGLVIGALTVSQLGIRLSDGIVTLSGGNMFLLLVLAALVCLILGMGMPSLPAYMMVVLFVAPALLRSFNVLPLATHLFVFYFACISFITPPVAIGAYVAAGLAGSDPFRTALIATRLGIVAYIVPFVFIYNPALLMRGPLPEIVLGIVTAVAGVTCLAWGLGGYQKDKLNWGQRALYAIGGTLIVIPRVYFMGAGAAIIVLALLVPRMKRFAQPGKVSEVGNDSKD
jgi:TRAP transporter 4TM/12TM fusion protein